jgi:hypothetical protein
MDWLQFTAAIVGHLAWPVVIIALFVILRKHMGALADRLLEFSFGGAKITFDKILLRGAEIIETVPASEVPKPAEHPQLGPTKTDLPAAEQLTKAVERIKRYRARRLPMRETALEPIFTGLEEVDKLLFEIGDVLGIDAADPSSVMYALAAEKRVPVSIFDLYKALRDARDVIANSPTLPDEREVREYVRQASYLKVFLDLLIEAMASGNETKVEK